MTTYQVHPGQQYDRRGARVEHGHLLACYNADGTWSHGDPVPYDDRELLQQAVDRVLTTRISEIVTIGGPPSALEETEHQTWLKAHDAYEQDWHAGRVV